VNNSYLNFFKFENISFFLPFLVVILYVPQSIYGIYLFQDNASESIFKVILTGLTAYIFSILIFCQYKKKCKLIEIFKINTDILIILISGFYFLIVIYAFITAERIAILESLLGGRSTEELAFAREALFKTRHGWEKLLPYINSMFTTAFLPFCIAISYIEKKSYRYILLIAFCISLLISMEKVLILKALMPIFFLGINGYFARKYLWLILAGAIVVISMAFVLTKFGTSDPNKDINIAITVLNLQSEKLNRDYKENRTTVADLELVIDKLSLSHGEEKQISFYKKQLEFYRDVQSDQYQLMIKQVDEQLKHYYEAKKYVDKYFIFGAGQFQYVLNRIFWIPYVTAYDWVLYFESKLGGEFLKGRTSSSISFITKQPFFNMEEEVFKFQYGTSAPSTAAANTNFWVEGYVNYGWIGVLLYSVLLAAITAYVIRLVNPALSACFYYFMLQLSMGGLTGVLLSNGLLLLLILAYFIPINFAKTPRNLG
jgi:hypothetical protein